MEQCTVKNQIRLLSAEIHKYVDYEEMVKTNHNFQHSSVSWRQEPLLSSSGKRSIKELNF